MIAGITYGTYLLFGCLTFLGAAFVWFFVPETKRLTLEEMVFIPSSLPHSAPSMQLNKGSKSAALTCNRM